MTTAMAKLWARQWIGCLAIPLVVCCTAPVAAADEQPDAAGVPAATPQVLDAPAAAAAPASPAVPATEPGAAVDEAPAPEAAATPQVVFDAQPGELRIKANLPETIRLYLPDPTQAAESFRSREQRYTDSEIREEFEQIAELTLKYLQDLAQPDQVEMSLREAIRRALLYSYAIRVQGYNPAIEATRVVQAEARFDAVFFFNFQDSITDQPIPPSSLSALTSLAQSTGGDSEGTIGGIPAGLLRALNPPAEGVQARTTNYQGGFRKLLASGAQVRTGFDSTRTWSDQSTTTLNPAYADGTFFEITQPFLRNFGLDVTRAEIQLRQLDRQIAEQRYIRQVQETIERVEQTYWNLVAARRDIPIVAELLAQTERVLRYFEIRLPFDVQPVQYANTQARLEARRSELISAINRVRDIEAQLKALINDPGLPIPAEQEIVPVDIPPIEAVVLNRLVEARTAMENRPEIAQAKYAVRSARVGVTVANNQRLPRLDVTLRYTANGLGSNPSGAFKQMANNDFVDYLIGVQFEWPIGNREREAGYRQARLQLAQAIASVKQVVEQVILEVDVAYRNILTRYKEMLPNAATVIAEVANLTAIQERADRRDPTFLDLELNTQAGLAFARRGLLNNWVQYGIGIINLELAKGTLLAYNNVRLEPRWDAPPDPE